MPLDLRAAADPLASASAMVPMILAILTYLFRASLQAVEADSKRAVGQGAAGSQVKFFGIKIVMFTGGSHVSVPVSLSQLQDGLPEQAGEPVQAPMAAADSAAPAADPLEEPQLPQQRTGGKKRARRTFNVNWQVVHPWLLFKEGDEKARGMYCQFCIDAGLMGHWATLPYVSIQLKEVQRHAESKNHRHAEDVKRMKQLGLGRLDLTARDRKLVEAWVHEFRVLYWLAKEEVFIFSVFRDCLD